MNHCLIITAYKDIESLNLIISKTPNQWGIYIHLDKKSTVKVEEINNRAIVLQTYSVNYASINHLKAIIKLLSLAHKENYDYYHIISGQDFFATNPDNFDSIIGNKHNNYLDLFPLPRKDGWWHGGLMIYQHRTLSSFGDIRYGWLKVANDILYYIQRMGLHRKAPNFPLYGGSVYCSLHRDFIDYVLTNDFAINFLKELSHTTCSEEIYFQTVIMNSPFKESVVANQLRYIDWSVPHGPKFLVIEDLDKIITSKTLFCRKIDSKISFDLIRRLEKEI